jgi:hypothetical protein
MNIPAWRILEKAILEKDILTILKSDKYRTEISLHTLPLLVSRKALRHIECVADYRTSE